MKQGSFVISLDFELMWGVRDKRTIENYGDAILGVTPATKRMLHSFEKFKVKATVATVGFLFFENKTELMQHLPQQKVVYKDAKLSPYPDMVNYLGNNEVEDPYHFGNTLLNLMKASEQIEIATHTFCHYYCLEPGQNLEMFEADLKSAMAIATSKGIAIKSIVFPRNQYSEAYIEICKKYGITSYRGSENHFIYKSSNGEEQTKVKRALRLLDSYFNITGYHCYSYEEIQKTFPYNIPSSRLLRAYSSKLRFLEQLKVKRITRAMTHAAKNNEVFHLWWHPHNFGRALEPNMKTLDTILEHYQFLHKKYDFRAVGMMELAEQLNKTL